MLDFTVERQVELERKRAEELEKRAEEAEEKNRQYKELLKKHGIKVEEEG